MSTKQLLESKIISALHPQHLEVIDESHMHNVPPGAESHFKVTIVHDPFCNKSLLDRHQEVYRLLQDEMQKKIHALSLHCYTSAEWSRKKMKPPLSPECRGGVH